MSNPFAKRWIFLLLCIGVVVWQAPLQAGDPTLDRLIGNMASHDAQQRSRARNQLVALCGGSHAPLLKPYLTSGQESQQLAALEVAGLLDQADPVLEDVATALGHDSPTVRFQAVRALGRLGGPVAAKALTDALVHADDDLKASLCDAMARSGESSTAAVVVGVLADASLAVRYAAARALWQIKTPGHENAVSQAAALEEDPQVRAWLLAYLTARGHQAGDGLLKYAAMRDGLLRDLVIQAGVLAQNFKAVDVWLETMAHESWRVRLDAARGLAALARPTEVPALIGFLDDERPEVRSMINEALVRIAGQEFGFQGYDSPAARTEAIKRWRSWWEQNAYRFDLAAK
jgi:HEAT repeat protein